MIGAALLATACATTYGEIGQGPLYGLLDDGGVAADRLTTDTWRIRSRVNEHSDPAMVEDYGLLRAAETAKLACATHFIVQGGEDRTEVDEDYTPASETRTIEKVKGKNGKVKEVEHVTFTDESYSTSIRPGADFYIRTLQLAPGQTPPEGALSADEIIANVGARVKRRKNSPAPVFPACEGALHARAGGL